MAGLDSARLRKWADELDSDERAERERAIEERIAELERDRANGSSSSSDAATIAELRQRLDALERADETDDGSGSGSGGSSSSSSSSGDDDGDGSQGSRRRRTRPGRKHGMVYAGPDGTGYVYDGEDEPDTVELDDDDDGTTDD